MKKPLIALLLILTAFSGCNKKSATTPPPLKACFSPSRTRIGPGDPVMFSNCSQSATFYQWDFGDGSSGSLATSPSYSYVNPGIYNVFLTAFSADRSQKDTVSLNIIVDPAYYAPQAVISTPGFTFNTKQWVRCNGRQSLHSAYYAWDFDNGKTSTIGYDSTFYITPGTYTIRLTTYSSDKTQASNAAENVIIK